MRPSETPLVRLFGIAFSHRPTAEKLAQFPTEYLPEDYHVLQQAMSYQLANTNGDYGFSRHTFTDYPQLKQIGTPAYRAALVSLHNRCYLGGTPSSDLSSEVPVLLRVTQEGKLKQGKKKLAERDVAAALPLLREGGLDPKKLARLQKVSPQAVELVEVDWDMVTGEEVWLWDKKTPSEAITLIAGEGGLGKSTTAVDLAACVSTGRPFSDGSPAPLTPWIGSRTS